MGSTITRREALKKSAVGLGMLAAPGCLLAGSARPSANDTLGIAIIGARPEWCSRDSIPGGSACPNSLHR